MTQKQERFKPEDFGFFLHTESIYPPQVQFYELDHPSIDKSVTKDWKRLNYFLSRDNDYVTIWYGPLDIILASLAYEEEYGFELTAEQHIDDRFKGYIRTNAEAKVILEALRLKAFPQYLG